MQPRSMNAKSWLLAGLGLTALVIAGCAPGDPRYAADAPAGFWPGLWHGIISVITLIIGLFNANVEVYERFNTGGWYDAGFLFGVLLFWGGGSGTRRKVWPHKPSAQDKDWDELSKKVEAKLQRKIREWAEAEPNEDWDVVGKKAEVKLQQKLREWVEDEPGARSERDADR